MLTTGSCVDAGYTSCCTHGYCAGYPPTCSCHPECTEGAFDCCNDFAEICPSGTLIHTYTLKVGIEYLYQVGDVSTVCVQLVFANIPIQTITPYSSTCPTYQFDCKQCVFHLCTTQLDNFKSYLWF